MTTPRECIPPNPPRRAHNSADATDLSGQLVPPSSDRWSRGVTRGRTAPVQVTRAGAGVRDTTDAAPGAAGRPLAALPVRHPSPGSRSRRTHHHSSRRPWKWCGRSEAPTSPEPLFPGPAEDCCAARAVGRLRPARPRPHGGPQRPPADHLTVDGLDPFRDEGLEYTRRLPVAGVSPELPACVAARGAFSEAAASPARDRPDRGSPGLGRCRPGVTRELLHTGDRRAAERVERRGSTDLLPTTGPGGGSRHRVRRVHRRCRSPRPSRPRGAGVPPRLGVHEVGGW